MASAIDEKVATGLGWFSIGLGLAELLAPRQLSHFIGMEDGGRKTTVLRTYGLREISAGVGILMQPKPAGWLWARVAGDGDPAGAAKTSRSRAHPNRFGPRF